MDNAKVVKASLKHEPNYRCAFCHEQVQDEIQAPCAGCGTLLHPECKVQAGGCPTLGCEVHPTEEGRPRARRSMSAMTKAELASWLGMGSGAAGMVFSFLALAAGTNPLVLAGSAGFVAGAVLLMAGVIAFTVVALRGGSSPIAGTDRRATATILTRFIGFVGAAGMVLGFATLGGTHPHMLVSGAAGFVAGAFLIMAGLVGYAALAQVEDEEA